MVKAPPETDVAVVDPAIEQLAASTLQNHELQTTVDELNAKLQGRDELIASQKKQLAELHTQLAELKKVKAQPIASDAVPPAPAIAEKTGFGWLPIAGMSALIALLALGWFVAAGASNIRPQLQRRCRRSRNRWRSFMPSQ